METKTKTERLHSLDAMRAVMMLLGLVVHIGPSYIDNPAPDRWPYSDPARSVFFDVVLYMIHMFRMPAFFLLAGFFARMMIERRGVQGFLENRAARILLPLVLFSVPLQIANGVAAAYSTGKPLGAAVGIALDEYTKLSGDWFGHLWFLHYLLFFFVALALCWEKLDSWFGAGLSWLMTRPILGVLVLAAPISIALWTAPFGTLDGSSTPIPKIVPLLASWVFFAVGAVLYPRREVLSLLPSRAWWYLIAALLLMFGNLGLLFALLETNSSLLRIPISIVGSIAMWLMVLGWLSFFLRYYATPSARMRYLSEASYWLYLLHHPLCLFIVGVIGLLHTNAFVKFSIAVLLVGGACLVTYHFLVRRTWMGVLLNGRRAE